uniref:C2H2-type domain-containing protein n=1 Tax=Canis lupus dingo TaxID=286419 RepID=A0A8C0R612_CANLU
MRDTERGRQRHKQREKTTTVKYSKVHMAVTHSECDENENNFSRILSLTQSQRTVKEQGAFASNKCDESLSQSSTCVVRKKTQTREEFCTNNRCINAFYQKLDLIVCSRTHTEKSFECHECRKSFYQKAELIHYQRNHSGEKPEECGESFCSNSHLIHYPGTDMTVGLYKCNKYGKTFCQKSNLCENLTIHTKEKSYENSGCGKSYKSALIVHQRTHTVMKPCQSNVYGKTFFKMPSGHIREFTQERNPMSVMNVGKLSPRNPMNVMNVGKLSPRNPMLLHIREFIQGETL